MFAASAICAAAVLAGAAAAAVTYSASPAVDVSPSTDPSAACTADRAAQQQTFDTLYPLTEPEPRAAINPANPRNIVAVAQEDRWAFGGGRGAISSATFDGGATWTPIPVPGITKCSGGTFDRASDPWVSFAPNGKLYGAWLVFDAFDQHNGVLVSSSSNGGLSWSKPTPVVVDNTNGDDKESITADPSNPSFAYVVWDRFLAVDGGSGHDAQPLRGPVNVQQTWFSRTTNGGVTWSPARSVYDPGSENFTIGNIVNVLPNGTLVDGFQQGETPGGNLTGLSVNVIFSGNRGVTWSKHAVTVATLDPSFLGPFDPDNGQPIRSGALPDFAVDPASGAMYAVWEDDVPTPGIDAIQFSESVDGGHTWSAPVQIDKTPTTVPLDDRQAFTPTVKVAADGTVGVTYYDLRSNTPAPGLPTDQWFVACHASCTNPASWTESHVAGPSDLEQAPFAGGYFFGDYAGLVTDGTSFGSVFDQATTIPGNPTDVYFARLTP